MDNSTFSETLRKLREKSGLSQKQLGKQMFVNQSTIARWESGARLPDAAMITRLAKCLGVDANALFQLVAQSEGSPNIIIVDDNRVILSGSVAVLEEAMPNATITGFILPEEAIEYAKINPVAMAFLDIELGSDNGLDLCRRLLDINPCSNIVFVTAYMDYSFEAWKTMAIGFILKPLTLESVREQLGRLRYPFATGGAEA